MGESAVLRGSLSFISLADIFQILGGNSSTGILRIKSPYVPDDGLIHFSDGSPVNSSTGGLKGTDAVYALFGWLDGEFEFEEKAIQTEHLIKKSRMEVVLDALRMLDDGEIEKVGPPSFDAEDMAGELGGENKLPVIKGPFVDYAYVVGEESFNAGSSIVTEGGYGKWLYVIYEGIAVVRRQTENGPMDIARLGEGAFIGTFKALLFGDYSRNASVVAEDNVQLCSLSTDRFQNEYTSLSKDFQNILLGLDNRVLKLTNRAVELYEGKDSLKDEIKGTKTAMQKGSTKKDLFVIKQGKAYILGQTANATVPLFTLEKNDIFGYHPFIDFGHEPQSASVVASEDLKVDRIDVGQIQAEYDKLSPTFKKMVFHASSSITMTTSVIYRLQKGA